MTPAGPTSRQARSWRWRRGETLLAALLLVAAALPGQARAATIYTQVVTGSAHSCGLTSGGQAKCWGLNVKGELGDNSTTPSTVPVDVQGLSGVTQLGAGNHRSCGVVSGGQVKCWGWNLWGQLGNGSTTDSSVPVDVQGLSGVTQVAVGVYHSCALLSGGQVKCWGDNRFRTLGDDPTTGSLVPVDVQGLSGVTQIAAGDMHSCALASAGQVMCWGGNGYGQLGNGASTNSGVPVDVQGLSGVTQITAGGAHSCALVSGGQVRCWGFNESGQLGNDSTTNSGVPVDVQGLGGVTQIAAGAAHSCALLSDGHVKCWGFNYSGQLGNGSNIGTMTGIGVPVEVQGLSGVIQLAPAGSHTCALISDGRIMCWGFGGYGALGNGTPFDSIVPRPVFDPVVPGAPGKPLMSEGDERVLVAWFPPASDGGARITSYTVTAAPGGQTCTWSSGPLRCTVTGLRNGALYTFTVRATNSVGTGPASPPSKAVRPVAPVMWVGKLKRQMKPSGKGSSISALLRTGRFPLVFNVPRAGVAVVKWYQGSWRRRSILVAAGRLSFSEPGTRTIDMKLTAAGRRLLRRSRKLGLRADGSFTGKGQRAVMARTAFTLRR